MNSMNVGDSSQRRDRGPQAKIFGIPQGTSEVVELSIFVFICWPDRIYFSNICNKLI